MNIFTKGLIKENPVLVLTLGMCASLATTTSVINGIGMGLSTTVVLVCSNIVISSLRKLIPGKVRIASYIVVIATFVTIVDMLMKAFLPSLSQALGVFIPLIVVNCIILARAEAFASKNSIVKSALDGLGMGLGFTLALIVIAAVREVLGAGTLCGIPVTTAGYQPATAFILPTGAFLTFGIILAVKNLIESRKGKNK